MFDIGQQVGIEIAELPLVQSVEVTGINGAVRFDDQLP